MINPQFYIDGLANDAGLIKGLLSGLDSKEIGWKPSPDKWNLLEVICHLRDEEKEDFRARLASVLADPEKAWTSIDPKGWVTERNYAGQDFKQVLDSFTEERHKSVEWLKSLKDVNWDNTHRHERLGDMSASYILANWMAHDLLHIRQITKLKYDYLKYLSGQGLSYAGDW